MARDASGITRRSISKVKREPESNRTAKTLGVDATAILSFMQSAQLCKSRPSGPLWRYFQLQKSQIPEPLIRSTVKHFAQFNTFRDVCTTLAQIHQRKAFNSAKRNPLPSDDCALVSTDRYENVDTIGFWPQPAPPVSRCAGRRLAAAAPFDDSALFLLLHEI
jgi:hypothetical protein